MVGTPMGLHMFSRKRDARAPIFLQEHSEQIEDPDEDAELPLESSSKPKELRVVTATGIDCVKEARAAARKQTALTLGSEVAQIVKEFCSTNPPCRVAPTEEDLQRFWSQCMAFQPKSASSAALAGFEHGFANAMLEQLQDTDCTHEWKPQFRALCTLNYLHRSGELERRLAGSVTAKAGSILRHLAAEVPACKEEANKAILLSKFAAELPVGKAIRMDEDGGVFVFTSKMEADHEKDQEQKQDDEEETNSAPGDYAAKQFSRDATDVETSATREESMPKHTDQVRQMSRCQSAPGFCTRSEESEESSAAAVDDASATVDDTPAPARAPAGTFLGAFGLKLYGMRSRPQEEEESPAAVPADSGHSRFWGQIADKLGFTRASSSSNNGAEALHEVDDDPASHTDDAPAAKSTVVLVDALAAKSAVVEAFASASEADTGGDRKRQQRSRRPNFKDPQSDSALVQPLCSDEDVEDPLEDSPTTHPPGAGQGCQASEDPLEDSPTAQPPGAGPGGQASEDGDAACASVHGPTESSSTPSAAVAEIRPADFELDDLLWDAVIEGKGQRPKNTELLSPLPAHLPAPPEAPAEMMVMAASGSTSPPQVAASKPAGIGNSALSTVEIAAEKAACNSDDPQEDAFEDSFSVEPEVAVEKAGLPGALGLAASRAHFTPSVGADLGAASGKRKQVAYIPWGIELTLPQAAEDPFAGLVDKNST